MLGGRAAEWADGRPGLELRIGINSGPVVAGVIGRKRFLYDLWGDAVNIAAGCRRRARRAASRSRGRPTSCSKDEFVLEPRGTIEIKGKGEMETWYLIGPRDGRFIAWATRAKPLYLSWISAHWAAREA